MEHSVRGRRPERGCPAWGNPSRQQADSRARGSGRSGLLPGVRLFIQGDENALELGGGEGHAVTTCNAVGLSTPHWLEW